MSVKSIFSISAFLFSIHLIFSQDTLKIYYNTDVFGLNQKEKNRIDLFLDDENSRISELKINGYADYRGSDEYNDKLSLRRAVQIKDYIAMEHKECTIDISVKGYGEIDPGILQKDDSTGIPEHRRVDIICMKKSKSGTKDSLITFTRHESDNLSNINADNLKVGDNILLKNLNFQGGRHFLMPNSETVLHELLAFLEKNTTIHIEIQGYICCERISFDGLDMDTGEMKLSVNRAKFVYEFLVNEGIDPLRMTYKGYGNSKPLIENEITEMDRTTNRRVEIKIISK